MTGDLVMWLQDHGLGRYASSFIDHDVDISDLSLLTEEDLREIGLPVGPRRRFLSAITKSNPEVKATDRSQQDDQARFPNPVSTVTAQRRQLTVMFCDMVGSTALSQQLDPEDLREVNRAYQDVCKISIERFGGYVAKYMGDGVLAYYGYPQAHEDDAERAVYSSIAIIESLQNVQLRLGEQFGIQIAVRIGIATGPVVVGDIIGENASQESAVVGATPNLAARLQDIALPNSIVISESANSLISRRFETELIGKHPLKGFDNPIAAWQVLQERNSESLFEARIAQSLTGLVGRDEEVSLINRRWQRAMTGEGQVVMLSGEPGIGKSRLTEVIREQVADNLQLRYQCSPYYSSSPFYPIIYQLKRAVGLSVDDDRTHMLSRLGDVLKLKGSNAESELELVAQLLALSTRQEDVSLNSQRQRESTLDILAGQLSRLCADGPVLCIFEDLHWIDPSSLELLDLIVDRIKNLPALLMVTFRPEFTPSWVGASHTALVSLNRMSQTESSEMIEQAIKGTGLPKSIVNQIVEKTDGVPLFVEELTRTVLDSQQRAQVSGSPELTIPTTLQDSLMARLDNLPPEVRSVAQLGAAIGRDFDFETLLKVTKVSSDSLADSLELLGTAGLVYCQGKIPHARFTFKHALVQDAAYQTLLKKTRRDLHARIAEILESGDGHYGQTEPEVLAQHYDRASDPILALPYWVKAAEQSISRSANRETLEHARRGLAVLSELPPDFDCDHSELDLQFALGLALRGGSAGFNSEDAKQAFVRAGELATKLGDRTRVISSLRGIYNHYFTRGEQKECLKVIDQIRAFVGESNSEEEPGIVFATSGATNFFRGELTESLHYYEKALEIYTEDREYQAIIYALNPRTSTLMNLGWVLWSLGYPDQAARVGMEAVTYSRALSQSYPQTTSLAWFCSMMTCSGKIGEISSQIEELVAITTDNSIARWKDQARFMQGRLQVSNGDPVLGVATMLEYMQKIRVTGKGVAWTWMACEMATQHILQGDIRDAMKVIDEGFEFAEKNDERYFEAELYRLKGLGLMRREETQAQAEKSLLKAIEVALGQDAKSLQLRASVSLAKHYRDTSRSDQAIELLKPIYDWFAEGLDTADLLDARKLLSELNESV